MFKEGLLPLTFYFDRVAHHHKRRVREVSLPDYCYFVVVLCQIILSLYLPISGQNSNKQQCDTKISTYIGIAEVVFYDAEQCSSRMKMGATEMWFYWYMLRLSWTKHSTNEEYLRRIQIHCTIMVCNSNGSCKNKIKKVNLLYIWKIYKTIWKTQLDMPHQ